MINKLIQLDNLYVQQRSDCEKQFNIAHNFKLALYLAMGFFVFSSLSFVCISFFYEFKDLALSTLTHLPNLVLPENYINVNDSYSDFFNTFSSFNIFYGDFTEQVSFITSKIVFTFSLTVLSFFAFLSFFINKLEKFKDPDFFYKDDVFQLQTAIMIYLSLSFLIFFILFLILNPTDIAFIFLSSNRLLFFKIFAFVFFGFFVFNVLYLLFNIKHLSQEELKLKKQKLNEVVKQKNACFDSIITSPSYLTSLFNDFKNDKFSKVEINYIDEIFERIKSKKNKKNKRLERYNEALKQENIQPNNSIQNY